jgi:hypothetical protein
VAEQCLHSWIVATAYCTFKRRNCVLGACLAKQGVSQDEQCVRIGAIGFQNFRCDLFREAKISHAKRK